MAAGRVSGMASSWIERRGLIVRADGEALIVTRGDVEVLPVSAAVVALEPAGLALWLAGLEWSPPRGKPWLRRIRQVEPGTGDWRHAAAAFARKWTATPDALARLIPIRA